MSTKIVAGSPPGAPLASGKITTPLGTWIKKSIQVGALKPVDSFLIYIMNEGPADSYLLNTVTCTVTISS